MELLVVIGIIAVLVALLFPALSMARQQAKYIQCASNLRALVAACTSYQNENGGVFPPPLYNPVGLNCYPTDLQTNFINSLAPYLGYPPLADTPMPLPSPSALPAVVCSPTIWENQQIEGPFVSPPTYWHTGYGYFGRLDECTSTSTLYPCNQQPTILTPDRLATRTHLGVLFADELEWYGMSANIWTYPHGSGVTDAYGSPQSLVGQHCAYSDGSVEWRSASDIKIEVNNLDASAGYKLYWGWWYYYWWF